MPVLFLGSGAAVSTRWLSNTPVASPTMAKPITIGQVDYSIRYVAVEGTGQGPIQCYGNVVHTLEEAPLNAILDGSYNLAHAPALSEWQGNKIAKFEQEHGTWKDRRCIIRIQLGHSYVPFHFVKELTPLGTCNDTQDCSYALFRYSRVPNRTKCLCISKDIILCLRRFIAGISASLSVNSSTETVYELKISGDINDAVPWTRLYPGSTDMATVLKHYRAHFKATVSGTMRVVPPVTFMFGPHYLCLIVDDPITVSRLITLLRDPDDVSSHESNRAEQIPERDAQNPPARYNKVCKRPAQAPNDSPRTTKTMKP